MASACLTTAAATTVALSASVTRQAKAGLGPVRSLSAKSNASSFAEATANVRSRSRVVCAVGDVSGDATNYLIAGAVAITLIGAAFPVLFSRKDICPQCDGAGFIRNDRVLNANAARKDDKRIVCPTCKGLGKLNQVDK
eukprot:TRINITY_DN1952_c0_g1_i1.p1 TRINITY_DN1952_c0_g1~~TRINITY_DN1952_c0_g1_i1.p1  ORF type:complete len:139 (+),score=0.69 TRINITY_DN1952_c0_g1_i1:107-523(+)